MNVISASDGTISLELRVMVMVLTSPPTFVIEVIVMVLALVMPHEMSNSANGHAVFFGERNM